MKYKIKVLKKRKGWYWRIEHRNGHVLAHSETYNSLNKARQTAERLYDCFKMDTCIYKESLGR